MLALRIYTCVVLSWISLAIGYGATTIETISPNPLIIGSLTTITASNANGDFYVYDPNGALVASITSSKTVTFTPTIAGTYTIKILKNGATLAETTVTTGGVATPTITFTPTQSTFCSDGAVYTINGATGAPGGGTYTYTGTGILGTTFNPATAGAGVYNILATYTTASGSASTSATFTVNSVPTTQTLTASSATYCVGGSGVTLSLNNSETGVSYQLKKGGVATGAAVNGTTGSPITWTNQTTGTYSVEATNTTTGCKSTMNGSPVITTTSLPTSITSGNASICNGANTPISVALTGALPWTLSYSDGTTTTTTTVNGASPYVFNVSPSSSKTYTITNLKDANGCTATSNTGSALIVVNPRPTSVISGSTLICNGQSATLSVAFTGSAPFAFTYTDGTTPVSLTGINSNPYTFTVSPSTTKNFSITALSDSKCTALASDRTGIATVTVGAPPTVNAGSDKIICSGDAIQLNATGAVSYSWDNGIGAVNPATVSPTTTTTYTVTGTAANGCTATDDVIITVNPLPSTNAGVDVEICNGKSATLTATGGTSYVWSTGETTPSITVSPISTTNYTVVAKNAFGCSKLDAVTVTVNPNPTVNAGADVNICHGDVTTLSATGSGGTGTYSYTWSNGKVFANITENPTNTTTIPIVYPYSVTLTDSKGCTATDNLTITVNPLPVVSIANLAQSYCRDAGPVTVQGIPTGPTGVFSINTGNLTPNGPGTASFSPVGNTPGTNYIISYSFTNGNGCTASTNQVVLVRNETSPTGITINGLLPLYCDNDNALKTINATVTSTPSGTYTATGVFSGNVTDIAGTGTATFTPSALGIGNFSATYTYTVNYTAPTGVCSASASAPFTVGIPVTLNVLPNYCQSTGPFLLVATKPAGANIGAFYIDGNYSGVEGAATTVFDPSTANAGLHTITYKTTNAILCSGSSSTTTTVHALPSAQFLIGTQLNTDLNISVCKNAGLVTLAGSPNAGGTFTGTGVTGNKFDPLAAGVGSHIINYSYTDAFGCTNSASATILVKDVAVATITGLAAAYCSNDLADTIAGTPRNDGLGSYGTWVGPTGWTPAMFKDNGDGTARFDPTQVTLAGVYTFKYSVNQPNGCVATTTQTTTFNLAPTVNFTTLSASYCENAAAINLTGSPKDANGHFTGNGIVDNNNGTAKFTPAGLSYVLTPITYTYTHPTNGCVSSITKTTTIKPKPTLFSVTGGGTYCVNNNTNHIILDGSQNTTVYTLKLNGVSLTPTKTGNGSPIDFGLQTSAGVYTVTAKNAAPNSCSENMTGSATVTINPLPLGASVITGSTSVCPNASYTYSIPALANATSYQWTLPTGASITSGAGTNSITVFYNSTSATGILSVKGSNACGDGPILSTTITVLPLPSTPAAITGAIKVCQGETLKPYSVAAVTNATSYTWTLPFGITPQSGSLTKDIIVNFAANALSGTISVAGVNACGTGPSSSLAITVVPTPNVSIDVPIGTINCTGNQITLNATTTTLGTSTYSWAASLGGNIASGGGTAQPKVDKAGTYTVTLTEPVNACKITSSVVVASDFTAPQNITVSSDVVGNILTCTKPQATLTASTTSTFPVSYSWVASSGGNIVSGGTTATPIVNNDGIYTVTVTNIATGCTATGTITLTKNKLSPVITINKTPAQLNCLVSQVELTSLAPSSTYLWTGPAGAVYTGGNNIPNPKVDKPGTYTLTATGTNGCIASDITTVIEDKSLPQAVSITSPATLTCSITSTTLTASSTTPSVTYLWSTSNGGSITSTLTNPNVTINNAGDYTVTVKHPTTFCTQTATVSVSKDLTPPTITFPSTPNPITCTTLTSTINSTITPVTTNSVIWTGPSITSNALLKDITVNAIGTYSLTATNTATGCTTTKTITVADGKTPITVNITPPTVVTCTQPSITLTGSTSITNYSALWTTSDGAISGSTTDINASVTKNGTYTLKITDNITGCSGTKSVLVLQDKTSPDINVDPNPAKLTCKVTQVGLTGSSTTPSATFSWAGPATATIIDGTTKTPKVDLAGIYTLTVTAPNGCTATGTVTVQNEKTIPALPSILSPVNLTCSKKTTNLEVSPLLSNVDYQWSTTGAGNITNDKSPVATVDAIGTYKVVVTNRTSGCTNQATVLVNETKTLPTASIAGGPFQITCAAPSLQLDASASVGDNPTWSANLGGHVASGGNSAKAIVDAAGTYTVTFTHPTTGCTANASVVVTPALDLPTLTIDAFPAKINCSTPSVTLSGSTSEPGTSFTWTAAPGNFVSGATSFNPIVNKAGNYIFEVTKTATGCKRSAAIVVVEDTVKPSVTLEVPAKLTCTASQVQLLASSTNTNVSYNWTTTGTGNIKTGTANNANPIALAIGTYTVTVKDLNNQCSTIKTVDVAEDKAIPQVTVNKTPAALNCTVSEVTLSGNSLTAGADFLWSTTGTGNILNATTKNPRVDAPGVYRLTVTHPTSKCTAYDELTVVKNTTPVDIWVDTNPLPLNAITPTTQIKGNSITPNVTYLWAGPGNISNPTAKEPFVDTPGTYLLTVTSTDNNCSNSKPVVVTRNNAIPSAPVATGAAICFGAPAATLTATGSNLKWYADATLTSKIHDGNNFVPASSTAAGTYYFFVTQTDPVSFNQSIATQVTYTVRALPNAPLTVDNAVCQGSANAAIQATPAAGNTVKWYDLPGGSLLATNTSYTPPAAVSAAGAYSFYATQTDAFACQSNATEVKFTINARPAKPTLDKLNASVCKGETNATFNASGDNVNWYTSATLVTPLFTGNAFTPTETNVGTYNYYVTQTSTAGCISSYETATFSIKSVPTSFNVTGGGNYCEGQNGKSIGLSGSETNTTYQLLLDGSTVINSVLGTGSFFDFGLKKVVGNYTVVATNNNGCSKTMGASATISTSPLPGGSASVIIGTSKVCQGESNVTFTVAPITDANSYLWTVPSGASITSGQGSNTITVNFSNTATSGTISVTGVNTCGSGANVVKAITVVATPQIAVNNFPGTINCTTPQLTLNATSSTSGVSYLWDAFSGGNIVGATNIQNPKIDRAGTYTVTVIEPVNSCKANASINVTSDFTKPQNIAVNSNVAANTLTCTKPQATLTASTSSLFSVSYSWTASAGGHIVSGETTSTPIVDKAGDYTVTVTSTATGCSETGVINIIEDKLTPDIDINKTPAKLTCSVLSVQLNGSAPSSTYIWTGPTGATFTGGNTIPNPKVDKPGTYTIVVTGSNGCTASDNTTVLEDKSLPLAVSIDPADEITCTSPTVKLTASTTTPSATYNWSYSNGGNIISVLTNPVVTVNAAGDYKVTVTHPTSNCTQTALISVSKNIDPPVISFPTTPTTITCSAASSTSTINTTISPSTYTAVWSGPGIVSNASLKDVTVNLSGLYSILVTNTANGCTANRTITITGNSTPPVVDIANPSLISCSQPTVTLIGSSSVSDYIALWSTTDGSISGSTSNLNAVVTKKGTYKLTITDNKNGCSDSTSVLVSEDIQTPDINVTPNPASLTCTVPQVGLTGSSSTPGVTYLWTGPASATIVDATTKTPKVDLDGTYTLTVKATNGCTSSANVTVAKDNTTPTIPIIVSPEVLTCSKKTTNLEVSPLLSNVDYQWSTTGAGSITNDKSPVATVDAIGTYKVVVTNRTSGCTNQATVLVNETKTLPTASIAGGPFQITCAAPSLQLDASASVGDNPTWSATLGGHVASGGNSAKAIVDAAGTYTVTFTHPTTGCTANASVVVTPALDLPTLTIDAFPAKINCNTPSVTLSGSTSEPGTSFTWTAAPGNFVSGATSFNPIVNKAGNYIFEVTKTATGCKRSAAIVVVEDTVKPSVTLEVPAKLTCTASQVQLLASSTNTNVSYNWTTTGTGNIKTGTANTANPIALAIGTYTVTVKDLNNQCSTIKTVDVADDKAIPQVTVNKTPASLNCTVSEVTLSGNSLTAGADFLWTTTGTGNILNATTKNPRVDAPGVYRLTVTHPTSKCTAYDELTVVKNTTPVDIWVDTNPLPLNAITPTTQIKGNSITPNVTYLWAGPGNISNPTAKEPFVDTPGTYLLTVTSTDNNCSNSKPVVVTRNNAIPSAPVATGAAICFGAPTATLTATGSNLKWYADATLTSKIHDGNNFVPASSTAAGTYYFFVTQTDPVSFNQSVATQVTYTVRALPNAPLAVDNAVCQGSANAAIQATPVAGNTIKWYDLPGGSLLATNTSYTPPAAVSAAGAYSFYATQTDAFACQSNATEVKFTINPLLTLTVDQNPDKLTCNKTDITLNGSASTAGANLHWTGPGILSGETTETPKINQPGTYTLTATDATTGCAATSPVSVTVIQDVSLPTINFPVVPDVITCKAPTTNIQSTTNVTNPKWQWSTVGGVGFVSGTLNSIVTVSKSGTYTLEITNLDNGCKASNSIVVSANQTIPVAKIDSVAPITCSQTSVTLPGSSSSSPVTVFWTATSGGIIPLGSESSFTPTVSNAGIYKMEVTNTANGCQASQTVSVVDNSNNKPVITINSTPEVLNCKNTQVQLFGFAPNATLLWTGPTGATISNSISSMPWVDLPGTYTIEATNITGGCKSTQTVEVKLYKPSVDVVIDPAQALTCTDQNIQLHGQSGISGATFVWSPLNGGHISSSPTSATITVDQPGDYKLEVSDPVSYCKNSSSINVVRNQSAPTIQFPLIPAKISCKTNNVELSSNVTTTTSSLPDLQWTGPVGATISNAAIPNPTVNMAGNYTLTATDPITGCKSSKILTVSIDTVSPQFNIVTPTKLSCKPTEASVVISANTSVTNYTALWNTSDGLISGATGLLSVTAAKTGVYSLTITNNDNGCQKTKSTQVVDDIVVPSIVVEPNPSKLSCKNSLVELFGNTTTTNATLKWTGTGIASGDQTSTPKVNTPGVFTLTVTAPNGCTATSDVTVAIDTVKPLTPVVISPDVITCNKPSVDLEVSNPLADVSYQWSTTGTNFISNANSAKAQVDKIGTYTVKATKISNGCTNSSTVVISQNLANPDININAGPYQINCTNPTLTITSSTSQGISPVWVASNGGHVKLGESTLNPIVDAAGIYTLSLSHPVSGCKISSSVSVTADGTLPEIVIVPFADTITCARPIVTLSGEPKYISNIFSWKAEPGHITADSTTNSPKVDAPGTYVLTVTDASTGCKNKAAVTVYQNIKNPVVTISKPDSITCTTNEIQIKANANVTKASYSWSTSGSGQIKSGYDKTVNTTVLSTGVYDLLVKDLVNGCSTTKSITVSANIQKPSVVVNKTPEKLSCSQSIVILSGSSSTPNVSYLWTSKIGATILNSNTSHPTVSSIGKYYLTITDNHNGCYNIDSVEVKNDTIRPAIWVNTTPDSINCKHNTVVLNGTSSTPDVTYAWSGPNGFSGNSKDASTSQKGLYTFTVTNPINGCTASKQVNVIENIVKPAPPLVTNASNCVQTISTSLSATGSLPHWYADATLSNDNLLAKGNTFMPNVTNTGTYTYYVTQVDINNGCESNPATATFVIKPRSARPTTSPVDVCKDQPVPSLTAIGENVNWYDAPNGTLLGAGNSYGTGKTLEGTYLYYVTQTQNAIGCESETTPAQLTIHENPTIPVLESVSYELCKGQPVPSLNVAGNSVNWYADSTLTVSVYKGNSYIPNISNTGLYTYYATQTSLFGCQSKAAKTTIKIKENPNQFNVSGGGSYCQGSTGVEVTLSKSEIGVTYQLLHNGSFTTGISKIGTGSPLSFGFQTEAGVYSVLGQTPDNCSIKMNGGVAIVMNPLPETAGGISGDTYVCQGKTASFIADSIVNAISYEWSLPAGATIISGANSRKITVEFNTLATSGTISVRGVNNCGYGIASSGKTVVVNPNPKPTTAKITGPSQICEGEPSVVFQIDEIDEATSYEWTIPSGAKIIDGAGTKQITVDFSDNDAGGTFTVRGINDCGKSPASAPFTVSIKKKPIANAGFDDAVCGSTTNLYATGLESGAIGEWSVAVGPGQILNAKTPTSQVKNLMMGENKFVWTVSKNGCTSTDTVVITNNKVLVDAGEDQVLCSKETQLNARAPLTGGQWSIVSGKANVFTPNSPTSDVSSLEQNENKLTWFVYNGSCLSSDTVSLINNRPLTPNAGLRQLVKNDFTQLAAKNPEAGTIGTWSILSGAGSFSNKNQPTSSITGLNPGVNLLQWTVTRNGCNLSDTVSIEFESYEAANAGPDQPICTNFTTLRANEPQTGVGQWSVIEGSATFENPKMYNTKVTGIGPNRNVLKWTIRRSGSNSVSDTMVIINNSVTIANAGIPQTICSDSTSISAGPAIYGTGTWSVVSGAGNFGKNLDANTYIKGLAPGENMLKWSISKENCYSESLVKITNNTPTKADAGIPVTTCDDSVMLAPNTPSIGTGSWSVISGSAIFKDNSATQLATNENKFRWTIKKGSCSSTSDVIITSHKPSDADAGINQPICIDSITLGGNKPIVGKGVWTLQNGSANIVDTLYWQSKVTNLGLGKNIFRWKITYKECSLFDDVEINNGFIKASANKDETICDDKYSLSANSAWPGKGTWSVIGTESAATFANVNSPNSQVVKLDKGNNTLRWTIINQSCVSYDDVVITNNLPSEAYAGPDVSICSTSTLLDANPIVVGTGKWEILSGSGVIRDINTFNSRFDSIGLGPNILRWSTMYKGCILSDEVKISNNEPVYVNAGKNQTLCDDSTSLYANRPSIGTGQWSIISGSAKFTDNTLYNTSIYDLAKGVNILKWTVKSNTCKVSDTVYVVNNLPSKSLAGPDKAFCQDSSVFAANKPEVGTGEWWIINGSATIADKTKYNSTVKELGFGENRFRWIITNEDCQLFDDMVLVNNLPNKPLAGENHSTCADSTVLFANDPEVGHGFWSLVSGSGKIANLNKNQTKISKLGFGPNTFRWTTINNSCELHDDVVVTNNLADVNAGIDKVVFEPTQPLIGNNPVAGNPLWKLTAGAGDIEKPKNFSTTVSNLGIGENTFTWTIENNGCVAADNVVLTYYNMPVPNFSVNTDNGCPPLSIDFVNKSIGGAPYKWEFGDGESSSEMNVNHIYSKTGTFKVRMTGTAPGGLFVYKDTVITVHVLPIAKFDYTPSTVYVPGQHVSFINKSEYAESFVWDFGDKSTLSKEYNPKHTYKDTGIFTVKLRAITNFGCTDSLTIENAIIALRAGMMRLPNAFTPNTSGSLHGSYNSSDYSNDVFYPIVIQEGIEKYNMKIFNRWGVKLFESDNIKIGWDGYYNGKLLEQDVYIYVVTGTYNNGEKFNKVGDVMLIRKP